MKIVWSIVLLASVVFSVAGPIFFGHGLVENETGWYGVAGVCLLIAALLFFVQVRFQREDPGAHH